jgi:hypothetical protein
MTPSGQTPSSTKLRQITRTALTSRLAEFTLSRTDLIATWLPISA